MPAPAQGQSQGQSQGSLFEQPFVVEHHMVQVDEHGDRFSSPPVIDTYGGSWIVSERTDGSRLVVDLVRRELTEIRPENGTYSQIGFERLAEVMERLAELEGTRAPTQGSAAARGAGKSRTAADWTIREGEVKAEHARHLTGKAAEMVNRDGVRHLVIQSRSADGTKSASDSAATEPATEVWVDPSMKIDIRARKALADFERAALGTEGLMEAAREHVDGAIPIRTLRGETAADGSRRWIEDVVIRLEKLESFDRRLITIPEGLRKVSHPLEGLMAYMEKEAERERSMSGAGSVEALGTGDAETFPETQTFTNAGSGGNE
jgi:hypothetical protein